MSIVHNRRYEGAASLTLVACAALLLVPTAMAPRTAIATTTIEPCRNCPIYSGAFSIENTTGVSIPYQYRWGSNQEWKNERIPSGMVNTHRYPMGRNADKSIPKPYVRFDRVGGDTRHTARVDQLEFYAVEDARSGARRGTSAPKRYVFRYAPNGRDLSLEPK